jgi:Carboxypeptidase regulatory-like domain
MKLGHVRTAAVLVALMVGLGMGAVPGALGQQDEDPTSKVEFMVVRDTNGKPVRAASVVLHPVSKKGKQARGGFELKTDNDGKTEFEGVPYGKMRIQVLAQGFQTYGDDYLIDKPDVNIVIKLKRPAEQYSVYQDQNGTPKDAGTPPPK